MQTSKTRDKITSELFELSLEQMWQVLLGLNKRRGCSCLNRVYVPRLAFMQKAWDRNTQKDGWMKQGKYPVLNPITLKKQR